MSPLQRMLIFIMRLTDAWLQSVNQHFVARTKPDTSALPASDADRFCQKQVRTGRRKCAPAEASHHPASTGEATCLYQVRPHAPGASGKNGTDLEESAHHSSRKTTLLRWHRQ